MCSEVASPRPSDVVEKPCCLRTVLQVVWGDLNPQWKETHYLYVQVGVYGWTVPSLCWSTYTPFWPAPAAAQLLAYPVSPTKFSGLFVGCGALLGQVLQRYEV